MVESFLRQDAARDGGEDGLYNGSFDGTKGNGRVE